MSPTARADVAIIGSGPAGVATAESLARNLPDASVAVLERGPTTLRTHFYSSGASLQERDVFLRTHQLTPWTGTMAQGGVLLPIVGGRGAVGGAQLHRFYAADMQAWPTSPWPVASHELEPYFEEAEARTLGPGVASGAGQVAALDLLAPYRAAHPPHRVAHQAEDEPTSGYPHNSSVDRLFALLSAPGNQVALHDRTFVQRLVFDARDATRAVAIDCLRLDGPDIRPLRLECDAVVLAGSPIESARLLLNSRPARMLSPHTGAYLAEHIYLRGTLDLSGSPLEAAPVNLFIPPLADEPDARFQLEIRSAGLDSSGRWLLRVTGSAAMDPDPDNRMTVDPLHSDEYGIPRASTSVRYSPGDERRIARMGELIEEVRRALAVDWVAPPVALPIGASLHESGTLRIGAAGSDRVADPLGLVDGLSNVYVGDGAAFPTVGVANPILTLTAMGYRLGGILADALRSSRP